MRAIAVAVLGLYTASGAGYTVIDSDEPGGPAYAWDDISTTGTVVPFTGIDDASVTIVLPFTFTYFGVAQSDVSICTNGFLQFGGFSVSAFNVAMPSTVPPNGIVAAFWDDLILSSFTVRYQTLGVAPARRFVVSWNGVSQFGGPGGLTFQAALYETSNTIRMQYQSIAAATPTATVGIENAPGDTALQYVFNSSPAGNVPTDGLVVEFTTAPTPPPPPQPPPPAGGSDNSNWKCSGSAAAHASIAALVGILIAFLIVRR